MDFNELARRRYSARAYSSLAVEDEKVGLVLEAARLAPTAANCQSFQIILIHTQGREQELRRIYPREWFTQAPLVFCICVVKKEGWIRPRDDANFAEVDAVIVMDHMTLAAASLGLGTCWIANFNPDEARAILGIPEGVEPVFFSPLGYAKDTPHPKERKSLDDIVHFERW